MTADSARAACTAAGLRVVSAEVVGRTVVVTVAHAPTSASGLQGLMRRLGGLAFSVSYGAGVTRLTFMAAEEA